MTSSVPYSPTPYLKLPFSFDVARLKQDLLQIEASQWIGHFNTSAYEKNWSCLPLRSVDGRLDHIMPVEESNFQDTVLLQRCPYFREVIDSFECEKTSIRLMSLEPGGVIKEHRDKGGAFEDGMTRLHIPILTSAQVMFRIEGEDIHFSAGDTWYLNASCLHGVENHSTEARVHLMIDCVSNAWLEDVFRSAGWVAREVPKYADPSVHDGNVLEVIAALRATGNEAALRIAEQLQATHAGLPA